MNADDFECILEMKSQRRSRLAACVFFSSDRGACTNGSTKHTNSPSKTLSSRHKKNADILRRCASDALFSCSMFMPFLSESTEIIRKTEVGSSSSRNGSDNRKFRLSDHDDLQHRIATRRGATLWNTNERDIHDVCHDDHI